MQNLKRRPSGIYCLRLAVPLALRRILGKREIIVSTGTRETALAKIVAGAWATQWRQRFLDLSRLTCLVGIDSVNHHQILKIVGGSPALLVGGYLPLSSAADASGLSSDHLLREVASGHLGLHARVSSVHGCLVPVDELEPVDADAGPAGGLVVPPRKYMPSGAVGHAAEGMMPLLKTELNGVATGFLHGDTETTIIALEAPGRSGMWFVPDTPMTLAKGALEVSVAEVERLRRAMAMRIAPLQVKEAKAHQKRETAVALKDAGRKSGELLSAALDHYIRERVTHDVESLNEITRIRNGCCLLIDLDGDVKLAEVTTEKLRAFRDQHLAHVPEKENKVRLIHKTTSVKESIEVLKAKRVLWPVMSTAERDKRMRWIQGWFRWLHEQTWIATDPAAPLQGESVASKAERREKASSREDEARQVFTPSNLAQIFSAEWFRTGKGELTKSGTYRTYLPFYYWGPLIAVLGGGPRINEVSQLHLSDIKKTDAGTWFIDFNQDTKDKKLKNAASRRQVPLHPLLEALGLVRWVDALKAAGHERLFPEWNRDADKGYGKAASKWFTGYMEGLEFARDGSLTFHSLRHTFTNALPEDTPERLAKQLTGHTRGADVHDKVYRKDLSPDDALPYLRRLNVTLPAIEEFDIEAGLQALQDALRRKDSHRGASSTS